MNILAIDYGEKEVGLAIKKCDADIIFPFGVLQNSGKWNIRSDVSTIVQEEQIDTVVVGMPYTLAGTTGAQAEIVEKFVRFLQDETNWDVRIVDERLTSALSSKEGVSVHEQSAMHILERFLAGSS